MTKDQVTIEWLKQRVEFLERALELANRPSPQALAKRRQRAGLIRDSVQDSVQDNVPDSGGNHIGGGPTYPPSSGGGATSSLTSSPPVVVTPHPPCSPSLSTVRSVFDAYQAAIQPHARLIDAAKDKIRARLRVFSEAELREAIRRFAADSWEMEHNAGRGAAWFFDSDKRIEGYVNLPPRNGNGNGHLSPAQAIFEDFKRRRDGQDNFIEGEVIRR